MGFFKPMDPMALSRKSEIQFGELMFDTIGILSLNLLPYSEDNQPTFSDIFFHYEMSDSMELEIVKIGNKYQKEDKDKYEKDIKTRKFKTVL